MSNVSHQVDVSSGVYTFLMYEHDHRIHVKRHGAPWLIIDRGHNAIFALLMEFIDNRKETAKLQELLKSSEEAADKVLMKDEQPSEQP